MTAKNEGHRDENRRDEVKAHEQGSSGDQGIDPQADPAMESREQVPAMVDPERPYVDGQQDPWADKRDPATGQIPADEAE